MITHPNTRREFSYHAPLPAPLNPYHACMHADPYCIECVPEGTVIHSNHDTESRSWWLGAPRTERTTFHAVLLLGAIGIAMGVQAKLRDNPTMYSTDYTRVSATRG